MTRLMPFALIALLCVPRLLLADPPTEAPPVAADRLQIGGVTVDEIQQTLGESDTDALPTSKAVADHWAVALAAAIGNTVQAWSATLDVWSGVDSEAELEAAVGASIATEAEAGTLADATQAAAEATAAADATSKADAAEAAAKAASVPYTGATGDVDMGEYGGTGAEWVATETVADTSVMVVSGFGTAAVNGDYSEDGDAGGKPKYTKTGYEIWWMEDIIASLWVITGTGGTPYYYESTDAVATPDLVTTWEGTGGGSEPIGTVTAGTSEVSVTVAPGVVQFDPLADAPDSPEAGWLYVSEADGEVYRYDGADWQKLVAADAVAAYVAASAPVVPLLDGKAALAMTCDAHDDTETVQVIADGSGITMADGDYVELTILYGISVAATGAGAGNELMLTVDGSSTVLIDLYGAEGYMQAAEAQTYVVTWRLTRDGSDLTIQPVRILEPGANTVYEDVQGAGLTGTQHAWVPRTFAGKTTVDDLSLTLAGTATADPTWSLAGEIGARVVDCILYRAP